MSVGLRGGLAAACAAVALSTLSGTWSSGAFGAAAAAGASGSSGPAARPAPVPAPAAPVSAPAAPVSAPAAPVSAGRDVDGGEVYSVSLNADGSGSATAYNAVAGVTSRQLYAELKARGVGGLRAPSAGAALSPATLTSCRYGTASLFRCAGDANATHQIHWANNGYAHPQVYFVDTTTARWPVSASTAVWNQAHGIDSRYVWARCPTTGGVHCVVVSDADYGSSCWQGLTRVSWDSRYNLTFAGIELNDYAGSGSCGGHAVSYAKNSARYRQDACHELGHALGMGHNSAAAGSCLYGTIINSANDLVPSGQDLALIAGLYSSVH